MAQTELPWLVWGRKVRPYAFAVSLAAGVQGLILATGKSVWGAGDAWSWVMAGLALVSVAMLWWGWWGRDEGAMRHGLILTSCLFAGRAAYIATTAGSVTGWLAAGLLACWAVASAGAWLLEASWDREQRGRPR